MPGWARGAVVYEAFPRNHGPDGTLAALTGDLWRLEALGIDVLWLMPIHPIGEVHRKGAEGSPYSVRDYFSVEPTLGTKGDMKALVEAAHARAMRVILDWVPNHVAWDHPLVTEHPGWVLRGPDGQPRPPVPEWSDVVGLDYGQAAVGEYMISALEHWVVDVDVDGFRCDVAGMVDPAFWARARAALGAVKPDVFLLAEAEGPRHHGPFDATYDWTFYARLVDVCRGRLGAAALVDALARDASAYPRGAGRLRFVENHDLPRARARFGAPFTRAALAFLLLSSPLPLVHAGLECEAPGQTSLFEREPLALEVGELSSLITRLTALRRANPVLAAGPAHPVPTRDGRRVAAFRRSTANDRGVLCAVNFSPRAVRFEPLVPLPATVVSLTSGARIDCGREAVEIAPFDHLVWALNER